MIYLEINGREVRCELQEETVLYSKHTGKQLKHIEVKIIVENEYSHEKLLEIIKKGEGINSTDGKGNVLTKWNVESKSYSYTATDPVLKYYHTLNLNEMEELKIDTLSLRDIVFHPYTYAEHFDGDILTIDAKVLLTETQYSELKKLRQEVIYFPVIRYGINNETREMRFGRCLWSRHTNGIKHELHLIDKRPDEDKMPKRIFQPEMFNMQDKIAEQTGILDELLTVLINKGLVGANEVKTIQEKAAARAWDVIEDFYRIDDLDEWDGF